MGYIPNISVVSTELFIANSCRVCPVNWARARTSEVFPEAVGPFKMHIQPISTHFMRCERDESMLGRSSTLE